MRNPPLPTPAKQPSLQDEPEKFLLFTDLRALGIPFTKEWIRRLELRGSFPRRVRISTSRVAWRACEIQEWARSRIAARDQQAA